MLGPPIRIYLACTVRGDRAGTAAGRVICERLQHYGHEVLTTHLLADDVETAELTLTEEAVYGGEPGGLRSSPFSNTLKLIGTRAGLKHTLSSHA